jgi:hypothetical protein
VAPRSLMFQQQIDALTTRIGVLSAEASHIRDEQAHGKIKTGNHSLAGIAAETETIEGERALLVAAKEATIEAETRAAREHPKTGTFGYQVFNESGRHPVYVVDEAGNQLPEKAVYSYEVVDQNPLLPEWAKVGKFGSKRAG